MSHRNRNRNRNVCAAVSLGAAAALLVGLPTSTAQAFCGFYVSGADAQLFNDATQVVLMRDGTRTVLSMQNDYKGPPQDFALVVPVPVVLQKENVKTLNTDVFKRVDTLSAPRLVEYWEQDPCPKLGLGNIGTLGHGAGTGTGQGFGSGHGRLGGVEAVKVEAQFEVGEYEIVILSAKDSSALDAWLRENKYKIPANAEPALKPYVQAGSKFFVAKVNVAKVKFVDGIAALSPLRFYYDTDKFELPVKLGLLNSGGTQDLIVNILAADRYEVANYPNVTIPTNLDVTEAARGSFGSFYASLFDRTLEKNPRGAVVTEYAWQATNCDPCPGSMQGMSGNDLASLGADVMASMKVTGSPANSPSIRSGTTTVTGKEGGLPQEVISRIVRQSFGRFRLCYEDGLRNNPMLTGKVTVKFDISEKGTVDIAADGGSDLPDSTVVACIVRGFRALTFPPSENKSRTSVVQQIMFTAGDGPPVMRYSVSMSGMKNGLILTRLHARYGKESLGSDLVFRKAEAITGGREQWTDGKIETGAKPAAGGSGSGSGFGSGSVSSFQGRYAIRHSWPGKIDCKEPKRGVWGSRWENNPVDGGPMADEPADGGDSAGPMTPKEKLAYVPRNANLASFTNITAAGLEGTSGSSGAVASDASVSSDGGVAPPATKSSKCGCRVAERGDAEASAFGALLLGMLASARRYRRRENG